MRNYLKFKPKDINKNVFKLFCMDITKPKFLYHGSPNKNIAIFEPRAESIRDPKEGPVIFGAPDKVYASMFLVPSDDDWTSKGQFSGQYYQAIADEKRYRELDKGGAIYTFSSESFETDLTKSMKQREWISRKPVKPIKKEVYESGLEAMKQLGVKVVFVTSDVFSEFRQKLRSGLVDEAFKLLFP